MANRRSFLKNSVFAAPLIFIGEKLSFSTNLFQKKNRPVVISTWNFGKQANGAAWEVLEKNGRALDAVEAGVKIPEADPKNSSVGIGGFPDRDGKVTLDACIMDESGNCGSVAALEHILHPITVARMVMENTPHVMLVGEGALQFALANGFERQNLLTPNAEKAWKDWLKKSDYKPEINVEQKTYGNQENNLPGNELDHDTIGMLALDKNGNLSGACTTSGMAFKMRGRVGDSPIIGAGLFVDNEVGAATCTGLGEEVIKIVGAHLVVELMRQGNSPFIACKKAVERIVQKNPEKAKSIQVAFIALNRNGEHGAFALQKGFNYALKDDQQDHQIINSDYYFK